MISYTTPSLILRSRDVGSHDRTYALYTRDRGKLNVRAISIRKADSKLQGSMTPHAILQCYIIAQRRFTLGGAVILDRFNTFADSLVKLWASQHIREVIDKLTKLEYHDARMFDIIAACYKSLNSTPVHLPSCIELIIACDLKMLFESGVLPDIRTREGMEEIRKRIALHSGKKKNIFSSIQEKRFIELFTQPFRMMLKTRETLSSTVALYAYVRALLLSFDVETLETDSFLKECIANKALQ